MRDRVGDYYRTPLGNRSPHAGGHWIRTLAGILECRVWSAATDDFHAAEWALLADFARTVPAREAVRRRADLRSTEIGDEPRDGVSA